MALTDANNLVAEKYVYDAFGQPAIQTGTYTVGDTEVFATITTSANRRAMPYTMPEDGQIQSISIYHEGGSDDLLLAVYSDNSGVPDQRLAVTDETEIHSYKGWQTVKLTSPIDVNEGDTIWLAWVFESNPGIRYESGTPGRAQSSQTWSGGMPSTFGSCTTDNYIYSIYANYTPDEQDENPDLIGNPYMFTGRRFDLETGLYYYRARYYDPNTGRFLQTDPAYSSINLYAYCGNNPLSYADPSGCSKILTCQVYATHLIKHYMYGEGEHLWYAGERPWKLISSDDFVCQQIEDKMAEHVKEWIHMADPKDPCNLKPEGSFGIHVMVQFDPS